MKNSSFWYLACPYGSDDQLTRQMRFEAVNRAAAYLMNEMGMPVFSPISMAHPIIKAGVSYGSDLWGGLNAAILGSRHCLGLIVLKAPGWDESKGVLAEIDATRGLAKSVQYMWELPPYEIGNDWE